MTLDDFEKLIVRTTAGPWYDTTDGAASFKVCTNSWKEHSAEPGEWICSGSYDGDVGWASGEMANFRFIAASRDMAPKLIAVVRAVQAALPELPSKQAWRTVMGDAADDLFAALAALEAP